MSARPSPPAFLPRQRRCHQRAARREEKSPHASTPVPARLADAAAGAAVAAPGDASGVGGTQQPEASEPLGAALAAVADSVVVAVVVVVRGGVGVGVGGGVGVVAVRVVLRLLVVVVVVVTVRVIVVVVVVVAVNVELVVVATQHRQAMPLLQPTGLGYVLKKTRPLFGCHQHLEGELDYIIMLCYTTS